MSSFSTGLPVEEIYYAGEDDNYIIMFKSDRLNEDNNFTFKYNEDIDISKFNNIRMKRIDFEAKYINISKSKVVFKDINLCDIASFQITYGDMLAIRKYCDFLTLSIIQHKTYGNIVEIYKDKIKEGRPKGRSYERFL